ERAAVLHGEGEQAPQVRIAGRSRGDVALRRDALVEGEKPPILIAAAVELPHERLEVGTDLVDSLQVPDVRPVLEAAEAELRIAQAAGEPHPDVERRAGQRGEEGWVRRDEAALHEPAERAR